MMRRLLAVTWLFHSLACITSDDALHRVSVEGFNGVRYGMDIEQASKAYGSPLESAGPIRGDERSCYYVSPRDTVGRVSFMVVDGRVARVDIDGHGPLTAAGVGVGDRESEVLRAYGDRVEVSPHKYTGPEGHYLTVEQGNFAIIFETDGTLVTRFRAGKLPEVAWVERCS